MILIVHSRRVARIWKRGGGGFFERVRKVQRTLTRIFIFLNQFHTVCPKFETEFKYRWSPKKINKRSSPKLSLIFRPKSEIQTLFHTESRHLLHNFGTQFPLGGGCFQFFIKNRPKKQQKPAISHTSQANGGLEPPPPPPPGYATSSLGDSQHSLK